MTWNESWRGRDKLHSMDTVQECNQKDIRQDPNLPENIKTQTRVKVVRLDLVNGDVIKEDVANGEASVKKESRGDET